MVVEKEKILFESANAVVYYEENTALGKPAVIKVSREERPSSEQVQLFDNEFKILQQIDFPQVRKAYKRFDIEGKPALMLEYIEGKTLKETFQEGYLDLSYFFDIAIKICQALGNLHQKNIIHKDINSKNILIDQEESIKIIDFGISSKLCLKKQDLGNPEKLEGTLGYISPEQTGRMNRVVDYRSDLYSLGVVFYEILTGRLPFESEDAMEIVHAHLAKKPEQISEISPKIPKVIGSIVGKLLNKNAEDRYQSAFGLKADLEKAFTLWQKKGEIDDFELATEDFSGKFQVPEKLYGRQAEIDKLLNCFETAAQGAVELLLITGYSGVGKSALVHEVHKPITERRGNFIEGKFDQFQRNIPYFAWIQAFKSFVNQLLTENAENLEIWKNRILRAVGSNGKVLTDVIPSLELIIGRQEGVTELNGTEAQNRFNFVFQNFVNAISKKDHPMVIFIDDWQWADASSLHLLKTLLTNQTEEYLLIVGAYRNNEVSETHPLMMTIADIKSEQVLIETLNLANLSESNVLRIISDALHTSQEKVRQFAKIVYEKTQGNPFFVTQMLKSLYEEGLLTFDFEQKVWQWDNSATQAVNLADNVVELLAKKVRKLPKHTLDVLKLAACVGNRFSVEILTIIDDSTLPDAHAMTEMILESALEEGLLIPIGEEYKFAHDRIQQAIYSLIPEENKKAIHLQIGKSLIKYIPKERQDSFIFDITNHWNWALELLDNKADKALVKNLNLKSGKKAKDNAAFMPAFNYFNNAFKLSDNIWEEDYSFALSLHTELTQTAFILGDFEAMEGYFEQVVDNAKSTEDKVRCYEIYMQYTISQGKQQETLDLGLKVLDLLDVPLSEKEPDQDLDIEALIDLPDMQDKNKLGAMQILDSIITPAWASNPKLFKSISETIINLSIKYGNSASSSVGYAFYGGLLCGIGDIDRGYKFGKLAVKLLQKYPAKHLQSKIQNLYISTVQHWKEHAENTIEPHFEAVQVGLETGDFEFAAYNIVESSHYNFLIGENLNTLEEKYNKNLALIKQLKQEFHVDYFVPYQQMIANFLGKSKYSTKLIGEYFDEQESLPRFIANNQLTLSFVGFQAKTIIAFAFEEYETALESAILTEKYKKGVSGTMFLPAHNFYYSLSMTAMFSEVSAKEKQFFLDKIYKNQKELRTWAKYAPQNYRHKYNLVNAELMRLSGQYEHAMAYYDAAIEGAKEAYVIQEEALANEIAAKFYLKSGRQKIAKVYINEAHYLNKLWGSTKKVEFLEHTYAQMIRTQSVGKTRNTISTYTSGATTSSNLDINSIMKASQALSGEVVLKNLLEKMMQIIIENAGAEKGCFILPKEKKWVIEAESNIRTQSVETLQSVPIEEANGLSDKPRVSTDTLYYVIRTKKNVVIDDASKPKSIIGKKYFEKCQPKSVLCMPFLKGQRIMGILYLENNLTTNAFTPDRIEVLNMLASQITISIENALLYENLEEKVKERTAEVVKSKEIIEKKNQDITASINYAQRIQKAMLTQDDKVSQILDDYFIFFKPRDIVSGDFYWINQTEPKAIYDEVLDFEEKKKVFKGFDNEKTIVTAVDCTGHGVPGAFMSMIGNDLLNESINLKGITNPAKILTYLHNGVRKSLKQDTTENRDGMDMALCVIDEEKKKIEFAGAKNPLIYIRDGELHQVKGDKLPIGGVQREKERTFTNHSIKLSESPTTFYLFSDGYQDQFGGLQGKKFMIKRFKKLLLEIHQKPMSEQKQILQDTLSSWTSGYNQLDDILVIGFRV